MSEERLEAATHMRRTAKPSRHPSRQRMALTVLCLVSINLDMLSGVPQPRLYERGSSTNKAPAMAGASDFLNPNSLTLAELWRATRGFEAVLFAFLHPRVTGKETGFLKTIPQVGVGLNQRAADTMPDGAGLAG